ncbi:replication initiation protein [Arsenophonus nasoniae]|uniref:Replication initiation protein n=1 Tax=Arsenophonus nasoniae TaxID=638 RepID=A0AA95H0K7_9GAMM|nr:replication initiation protein [Arsenophonus nasoniae]WGM03791.1 replication initiation protein [Arsenophonus nasoniae]WGM03842.1 replication initiation protein [Arsenophonus nasoniae]
MSASVDKDPNYNLVQSNDLIEASYKLTRNEMRLLILALSRIDSKISNPGRITLYPKEFIEMFNTNEQKVWVTMRDALIGLMKKQIEFFRLDNKAKKTIHMVNWLDDASFYKKQEDCSKLSLCFSRSVEPYLFELKGNFTVCSVEAVQKLTNPIALRIYWILLSYIRKAKNREHKKGKKLDVYTLMMPIHHFRAIFPNLSKSFDDLKKRTLIPAFEQIQSLTDISLNWRTIKTGRSITDIEITYILEKDDLFKTKPIRPRLAKRPHVKSGSHDEGEWMKKNAEILYQYEKDLKKYDNTLRLTMPDLRRAVECSKFCKQNWHEEKKRELAIREGKIEDSTPTKAILQSHNKILAKSQVTSLEKELEEIPNFGGFKQIKGQFFDKRSAEAAGYNWDEY